MIEPINNNTSRSTAALWEAYAAREAQEAKLSLANSNVDTDGAEEEVVSLWYLSSIKSMQASEASSSDKNQAQAINVQAVEQTRFQKIRSWLSGWFGGNKVAEAQKDKLVLDEPVETSLAAGLARNPQLQAPEVMNNEKLAKAIADLNKDLLHRLRDTAEFADEMLNSNSSDMDRLILFHIVNKSMDQKKLKEGAGIEAHEHILNLQKQNKNLHQKHYNLLDEIQADAKKNEKLHWVSLGTTAGIVGTMAVGFATGGTGAVFSIALPALNILKGGLSGAEGILKYKNDLRTGEMTMINHGVKSNRNTVSDKLNTTLPFGDEEISHLLKTVRQHLENYSKEARLNPQSL